MKIFNSYTDQIEEFISKHENKVGMYICGPTVYNYIHIGNARPVVFFDTVRRYFESKNYDVTFVSNFTDIDDKIIQKALEDHLPELTVSSFYINAFLEDLRALNCKDDYIQPKVTNYMSHIVDYIKELVDKGYAYEKDGDVYFRVSKIENYGTLANRDIDDLISGSRVDVNELKENPLDITLWKKTSEGINFESPFSKGRPGWHTECVAMIDDIFGEEIDIHGGGMDLKFPHHENEIAQAEATHHHRVARYWMHNGRLSFQNAKMSKSVGNVILVKDVEQKMALRFFLLSTHYRSPLNYTDEGFAMYIKEWDKLENTVKSLFFRLDVENGFHNSVVIENDEVKTEISNFNASMDNDFNTANAITALQELARLANINLRKKDNTILLNETLNGLLYMTNILGFKFDLKPMNKEERELYHQWQIARKSKDFKKADQLRAILTEKGVL